MFTQLSGSIDRHILSEGYFEAGVLRLIEEQCRNSGHTKRMIDIGANIGNHSVGLSHVFDNIECVEPHPVLFKVLEANILVNNIGHARGHNVGLANEHASGTLVESTTEHGLSRVKERSQLSAEVFGLSSEQFGTQHSVSLISAEEFVRQFSADLDRTFIKIDVEGMEEEIMAALRPIFEEFKPLVGFEWFTKSQPGLAALALGTPGYELWGIRLHDKGRNYIKRSAALIFWGRHYTFERLDPKTLDEVYPLAFMVPANASKVSMD